MSYNKYLQQKADIPLYLATAEPNQTGNLQAELSDRNNNVTQKIKKSSADLINFYEGAETSSSRAKFVAASLLKMIAVSAFVKFIGDFAGGYGKGMNGYYNDKTDTVVIFADNIQNTDHLEKTFAHETAGHKGLQVLLGNEYTSIIDEIYSAVNQKHGAELQELAATYGQDLNTIEGQRYIIEEYLANQADLQKLSGFKSFVQKIKLALRKAGFRAKWTDDEITTLMRRSLENIRKQRSHQTGNNNGARFSIIGEKGAAALDAYSYQNNLDNLQTAKQMFEAGEDAADIKLATGWEKGGDGKWRMEVPDLTVIIKRKLPDGNEYNVDSFAFLDDYLENIVNAPELFSAYGQLRRIRVRSVDLDSLGSYSKQNNTIYLNYNDFINLPTSKQELLLRSVLIHEVQHAIQDIEGFASGGNTGMLMEQNSSRIAELETRKHEIEQEIENGNTSNEEELQEIEFELNQFDEEIGGFDYYKRLAGEVEARNAERRQFFTEEEKRNSLLEASEDVAEESKIYLFDNAGESQMAEPFTEQQKRDLLQQARNSGLKNIDVIEKMLYGGSITVNGNTVNFNGKNSHALKRHLDAPGFKPQRGPVTLEEIQKYLPEALKQKPKIEVNKGKKGRKSISKIYTVKNNDIVYTLVTREKGDLKSFYSNKKATSDVTAPNRASASSKSQYSNLSQLPEKSSGNQEKIRKSISPVDGDGFVSTADREKMITVLMGIPQQQLDNMDGAAALDYLTQKQFKVPSDDMAQSLLNTARQRRKDIIKQFANKRRKNWIMDNYPFYRALVELGGENAKVLLPKGELYKNYSGSFFARGKLKNGTAVPLKDIVDKIQASGTDTKNLESKVLKFFDGLNISKLQQSYRDSMFDPASKTVQEHENYLLNKLSENKIFSEKEAAELQTLKEKYNALGLDLNIDNINIDTAQPAQTAEKLEPVTNLSADQKQQLAEEGTKEHPTSRRYELKAEDGATLKVIIDFNKPNDKNKSVINFYSDRESDPRGQASSGGITDLTKNLSQFPEKSSGNQEKIQNIQLILLEVYMEKKINSKFICKVEKKFESCGT